MPKYEVDVEVRPVIAWIERVEVEAEDEQEAKRKALLAVDTRDVWDEMVLAYSSDGDYPAVVVENPTINQVIDE